MRVTKFLWEFLFQVENYLFEAKIWFHESRLQIFNVRNSLQFLTEYFCNSLNTFA
jgi:hypothetical protein